ncbi:hypothetical protein ACS15_0460 [Ralstonia insidiosa]|uniref:Uncharacterized protein n=1 Tax=Ralstonia insidiosa TaxID=190721 RepID=A0AAC9BIT9_9RALS|nr:hypothetical protein ACS15_0460 [Ralstonia insidiosa]
MPAPTAIPAQKSAQAREILGQLRRLQVHQTSMGAQSLEL